MAVAQSETRTQREQVVKKAQRELEQLAKKETTLRESLPTLADEIAHIEQELLNKGQGLLVQRPHVEQSRTAHAQARDYALLAQGTFSEQPALAKLAEAESALHQAVSDLQRMESEFSVAQEQAQARLAELTNERDQALVELDAIGERRASLERSQAQARQELGEAEYQDISAVVETLRAQIADRREALLSGQLEMERYLRDEAVPRLSDWPEHLRGVHDLLPPRDDAVSAVLSAQLAYIDTLLSLARDLPLTLNSALLHGTGTWLQALAIPDAELWARDNLSGNPTALRNRRETVKALLDERRGMVR